MATPFSALLADFAGKTGPEGARAGDIVDAMGRRSFGALAFKLGVLLLIPLPILPQIVGVLLFVEGLRLLSGAGRVWLPLMNGVRLSPRVIGWGARAARFLFGWAENAPRPQLAAMTGGYGVALSAAAMILAGVAAFFGGGLWLSLGLILLGFGLMQEDGFFRLAGVAFCLGAGAFTLVLLIGALTGAPYAAGWLDEYAPWLDQLLHPAPSAPTDSDSQG